MAKDIILANHFGINKAKNNSESTPKIVIGKDGKALPLSSFSEMVKPSRTSISLQKVLHLSLIHI